MQEFLIRSWCDRHDVAGQRVEATEVVNLSLPGYVGRAIDLCDDCHAELLSPLLEVVAKNSRPAGQDPQPAQQAAKKPQATQPALDEEGVFCPVCSSVFSRNDLMTQHYRNSHTAQFGPIQELFGKTCPLCNEEFGNLGVHANRGHGESGAAGAFRAAELQGDPHGVLRALRGRIAEIQKLPRSA